MTKKNWRSEGVPYHVGNNAYQPYPGWGAQMVATPEPFWATLKVVDYERGLRSATIWLECMVTEVRYPMFFSDFVPMVRDVNAEARGEYLCQWDFVKRGQNYGIVPVNM